MGVTKDYVIVSTAADFLFAFYGSIWGLQGLADMGIVLHDLGFIWYFCHQITWPHSNREHNLCAMAQGQASVRGEYFSFAYWT